MEQKIGLLVGREWSFPPAFIEEVNRRQAGVVAEYVSLDITRMGVPGEYAVIIDRISHEVGFYRAYLKHASLLGTKVVNNPFNVVGRRQVLRCVSRDRAWRGESKDSGAPQQGLHPRHLARGEPPQPEVSDGAYLPVLDR